MTLGTPCAFRPVPRTPPSRLGQVPCFPAIYPLSSWLCSFIFLHAHTHTLITKCLSPLNYVSGLVLGAGMFIQV